MSYLAKKVYALKAVVDRWFEHVDPWPAMRDAMVEFAHEATNRIEILEGRIKALEENAFPTAQSPVMVSVATVPNPPSDLEVATSGPDLITEAEQQTSVEPEIQPTVIKAAEFFPAPFDIHEVAKDAATAKDNG